MNWERGGRKEGIRDGRFRDGWQSTLVWTDNFIEIDFIVIAIDNSLLSMKSMKCQ